MLSVIRHNSINCNLDDVRVLQPGKTDRIADVVGASVSYPGRRAGSTRRETPA